MKPIRAKKSLGQNFLIDIDALVDISSATEITNKNIVEVGPGYGALTDFLLENSPKNLTLVELDTDMIEILEEKKQTEWKNFSEKITILHTDVLKFSPEYEAYALIANIPYYITSPILFHFLYPDNFKTPDEMVILMQKEVGEKILAEGRKNHFSYFSLAMWQACERIDFVRLVPASSFDPAPKVGSIVLRFIPKKSRNPELEKKILEFWNIAFKHPRKTLAFNLKSAGIFPENFVQILEEFGYSEKIRAEAIAISDWEKIIEKSSLK